MEKSGLVPRRQALGCCEFLLDSVKFAPAQLGRRLRYKRKRKTLFRARLVTEFRNNFGPLLRCVCEIAGIESPRGLDRYCARVKKSGGG